MKINTTVLIGTLAILSACGGGGGSNSSIPSTSGWVLQDSFSMAYSGSLLATNSIANADGTSLYIFGGPGYDASGNCLASPYKAVKVDTQVRITDASNLLNQTSVSPIHPRKLLIADLNGDGKQDLFFANHGCDKPPFPGELNNYFLSSGNAFVDKSTTLPQLNNFTHSAASGDLRKTGAIDILVGVLGMQDNPGLPLQYQGDNTSGTYVGAYLLRNDGFGNLTYDNTSLPLNLANPNTPPGGAATTRFTSSEFADLNGDGFPDLVVGADQNASVAGSVFLNDKNGGFKTTELPLPVGLFGVGNTITVAITVGDFNNDGKPDLLLSQTPNSPQFYGGGKIQVLINKGGGLFEDQTAQIIPNQQQNASWTQWIHLVDLNGDGRNDILLENDQPHGGDVLAYASGSDGTFKAIDPSNLPSSVKSLRPLNINGKKVLVSAYKNQGNAVINVYQYK